MVYYCPDHPGRHFSSNESLYQHATNSSQYHHVCLMCERVFVDENALENHTTNKHGYICKTCNRHFRSQSAMDQHNMDVHNYVCSACDRTFYSQSALNQHNFDMHNYACSACDRTFCSQPALDQHDFDVHNYLCQSCNRTFYSQSALEQHNSDKHSYFCRTCSRNFYHQSSLDQHNAAKHNAAEYNYSIWRYLTAIPYLPSAPAITADDIQADVSEHEGPRPNYDTSDLGSLSGLNDIGDLNPDASIPDINAVTQSHSVSNAEVVSQDTIDEPSSPQLGTEIGDNGLRDRPSGLMVTEGASNAELFNIPADGQMDSPRVYKNLVSLLKIYIGSNSHIASYANILQVLVEEMTLMALSSALGCHNYHETSEAINEDEADIVRILQSVIDCDTDKETILRLRKDHAEYFWTLIRDIIGKGCFPPEIDGRTFQRNAEQLFVSLTEICDELPSSSSITTIENRGTATGLSDSLDGLSDFTLALTQGVAEPSRADHSQGSHAHAETAYMNTALWLEGKMITLCIPSRLHAFQESAQRMRGLSPVSSLLESSQYRIQLIEFSSSLNFYDEPDFRDVLSKDEAQILHLIRYVLNSTVNEQIVLSLREENAMVFLNLLCTAMKDKSFSEDSSALRKAQRLRQKLSTACNLMPDCLRLEGIHISNRGDPIHGGGFADIFRGLYRERDVAVKRLRVTQMTQGDRRIQRALVREALVWERLKHDNVLPFLGLDLDNFPSYPACIVTPWMKNGTILDHIQANGVSTRVDALILEIAQGLAYLHSQNVVHGDLRSNNILIDDYWHVRLADFGLADSTETTRETSSSCHQHGAKRWMAPELFDPDSESYKRTTETDVYSFACACLEIYTGKHPFSNIPRDVAVMFKVRGGHRPPRPSNDLERKISDNFWHIIELCWSQEAADRPDINSVLEMMEKIDFGVSS